MGNQKGQGMRKRSRSYELRRDIQKNKRFRLLISSSFGRRAGGRGSQELESHCSAPQRASKAHFGRIVLAEAIANDRGRTVPRIPDDNAVTSCDS